MATVSCSSAAVRMSEAAARTTASAKSTSIPPPASVSRRRSLLQLTTLLPVTTLLVSPGNSLAVAAETTTTFSYNSKDQGYTVALPPQWEQYDKAGADAIFRDRSTHSTTVGITVLPVRVASLQEFGNLNTVTSKLVEAEKAKESTLSVDLLSSTERSASSGISLYDIDYELESTRGRKRILSTVTIVNNKLYIVNGNVNCGKESCAAAGGSIGVVKDIVASFQVN